jgi:uncharacterized membrane protein required for colicin V production
VDIVGFITSLNLFDLVVILFLVGMFVLGFIQGSIRRVVGILCMTFSFFLAAVLSVPVGEFLAGYWTYHPTEYSVMIGFLAVFITSVVALFLLVQGTYQKTQLFAKHPVIDEVLGGVLGVVQGLLLLLFLTIILDQYFLYAPTAPATDELPLLRPFWEALNTSEIGAALHQTVIPSFLGLVGFFIPDYIEATYNL